MVTSARHGRISVVIPVYRAASILPTLHARLDRVLSQLSSDYEIIFIDDRSPDGSWEVLCELARSHPQTKAVRLSRNFGQHYAITAGLDLAAGDWTVVMDCDLQDRPEEIPALLATAQQGYEVVLARRGGRGDNDGILRRTASRAFHASFRLLSGYGLDPSVGAFRVLHRDVVRAFRQMREAGRFFGGQVEWLGFATGFVDVEHARRADGRSSYNLRALLRIAFDGLFGFSNRPLYVSIGSGVSMSVAAAGYACYLLLRYLANGSFAVPGWASEITMTAFIGGLILMNLGVVGIYVGRIYNETRHRPLYVIDEAVGVQLEAARSATGAR